MKVDITKFWIEGVLLEHYPQFHQNQGADLDENGAIEGSEVFYDLDGNGTVGNRDDYKRYLELNHDILSAQISFFKWGEKLSVNNRIHQLMYLESDLIPDITVKSAYLFLSDLIENVNERIDNKKFSQEEESQLYYSVMKNEGGIILEEQINDCSFISNLIRRKLDCDTLSFATMVIGDERDVILWPVKLPQHIFLRGQNEDGYEFNIEYGFSKPDAFFYVSPEVIEMGYFSTLNDQQLEALFLFNRGNILADHGCYKEALAAYHRSLEIEPNDIEALHNYNFIHNIFLIERGYTTRVVSKPVTNVAKAALNAVTSQSK